MIRVHVTEEGVVEGADALEATEGHPSRLIEVTAPDAAERAALIERLGLHELAVEDALREGHPPKLEEFDDHVFLIAHTPVQDEDRESRKVAFFLGDTWLVTITREPHPELDAVLARIRRDGKRLRRPGVAMHAVLDAMTDGFERRADELLARVESLEERAEREASSEFAGELLTARSEVAELARIERAQRDVFSGLMRIEHPALHEELQPYLRDVYDHVVRVVEDLGTARETLGAARDTHMSAVNNRLSEVMRVLTVIATIMMPLSLLAGIYGMNFQHMPGTESRHGFWVLIGAMAAVTASMLLWFRRRRWI